MKIGNTILKTIGSGKYMVIRRGDIFYADLRPVVGSEREAYARCSYTKRCRNQPAQSDSHLCGDHFADE